MSLVYLTTAPNLLEAEMWRDLLIEEGIKAIVAPGSISPLHLGVTANPSRIMVLAHQLEKAKQVLEARLGHEG